MSTFDGMRASQAAQKPNKHGSGEKSAATMPESGLSVGAESNNTVLKRIMVNLM